MANKQKEVLRPSKGFVATISALVALSLAVNIYQYYRPHVLPPAVLNIDVNQKITQIEAYLDQISPDYLTAVQALAKQNNLPSWGCGPSSYALAKILDAKFFDNKFPISAMYDSSETYQIVERFSFVKDKTDIVNNMPDYEVSDHAWLEVYFGNTFLYIDPTIGQFGKYDKIVYEQFTVGDPNLSAELSSKYDITDIRFARLMKKMIDRIPADQEPYPGASINSASMDYYDLVLEDSNDVNAGQEPSDWKNWVATLTNQFQ